MLSERTDLMQWRGAAWDKDTQELNISELNMFLLNRRGKKPVVNIQNSKPPRFGVRWSLRKNDKPLFKRKEDILQNHHATSSVRVQQSTNNMMMAGNIILQTLR